MLQPNRNIAFSKYPFGSTMAERGKSFGGGYKFGFNNQEKEADIGEYYSFEYRIHDARLGRFLSVDPLAPEYPWNSTYAFAENRVIDGIDLEGLEWHDAKGNLLFSGAWDPPGMGESSTKKIGNTTYTWSPIGPMLKIVKEEQIKEAKTKAAIASAKSASVKQRKQSSDVPDYKPTPVDFQTGVAVNQQKQWEAAKREVYSQTPTPYIKLQNQYTESTGLNLHIGLNQTTTISLINELGPSPIAPQQPSFLTTIIPFVGTYANNQYSTALSQSGRDGSSYKSTYFLDIATILPIARIGNLAFSAAKGVTKVEQYALRAAEDGFYPVMKRGFKNPQELTWLNKGDVWKYGTTKNPHTRCPQSYLDNIGDFGVNYRTEFSGTLQQALTVERMKILNFRGQSGFLPAGNKIVK